MLSLLYDADHDAAAIIDIFCFIIITYSSATLSLRAAISVLRYSFILASVLMPFSLPPTPPAILLLTLLDAAYYASIRACRPLIDIITIAALPFSLLLTLFTFFDTYAMITFDYHLR